MKRSTTKSAKLPLLVVILLWLSLALAGLYWLNGFSGKAGAVGTVPPLWPTASTLTFTTEKATLIMFLHPRCSCSKASLGEFEKIITKSKALTNNLLVFINPPKTDRLWYSRQDGLWNQAKRIPNTRMVVDHDGQEAKRFGAETSGQVVLYNPDGALAFAGGITASRAHEGDNQGEDALLAAILSKIPAGKSSHVYGCGLFNPSVGSADMR